MTSDWTPHAGGEMPVPGDTIVEVRLFGGYFDRGVASLFRWPWINGEVRNIAAYRIIERTDHDR